MRSSFCLVASFATLAMGLRLEARDGQTSAVCQTSFDWMENSKHDSPCQVAASVDAVCNSGQWTIPALSASVTYTNPVNLTATPCTCSWASYNLLSACVACQGFPEQIPQWTVFKSGCTPAELSDTFFPEAILLPSDVAIPAWAQQDPTEWINQEFSVSKAQSIEQENKPDFIGGTPITPHKKTNIGAIVGGVIGGLIVIVGGVIIALWMIRRQRKSKAPSGMYDTRPSGHMRSMSDLSTATNMKSEHGPYVSLPPNGMFTNPPTSPTVMTHTSSVRSAPYMSSVAGSTVPYGTTSPPPHPITRQGSSTPIQDMIEPFTLPPTVDNPDRKQANGGYPIQVYDSPTAPPPNIMRMDSVTQTHIPSSSRKFNPPTYNESIVGRSSPRPQHREKQLSTDTQTSLTSSRNAGHAPAHSGSGMENIVEVMGPPPPHESYESEYGRQVGAGPSRDEKRRPPAESLNGHDLA